jgi:hypothetical protein
MMEGFQSCFNLAFKFNFRHYTLAHLAAVHSPPPATESSAAHELVDAFNARGEEEGQVQPPVVEEHTSRFSPLSPPPLDSPPAGAYTHPLFSST